MALDNLSQADTSRIAVQHGCLPLLKPAASGVFTPIERLRLAGVNYVSINVGMDMNPVSQVMAVIAGCGFVRVHDVEANRRAIEMTRAIMEQSRY